MNVFWIIYTPYLVGGSILIVVLLYSLLHWVREDDQWYKYEAAYEKWVNSGRVGNMPELDSFKKKKGGK